MIKRDFPGTDKLVNDVIGFTLAVAPGNHSLHLPTLKVSVLSVPKEYVRIKNISACQA